MTMDTKHGAVNVLKSLVHYISGNMPAKISTHNAAASAALIAYLKGSYVFSGSKSISITRNNAGTPITVVVPDGTYTATQLAAVLNGDTTFAASLKADTVMSSNYLRIYDKTRGTAGSLKAGDTTGNVLLGWQSGYTSNYMPLRDLAEVVEQFDNVDPMAFPSLQLRCESVRPSGEYPEMLEYDIVMRLFEVSQGARFDDLLYNQLLGIANLLRELLAPQCGGRNLDGQVNGIWMTSYNPGSSIEGSDGPYFRAWIDFNLTITVQEDD